jgi:hypothetical protein
MTHKCKRIIGGKTYNTETATQIAEAREDYNSQKKGAYLYQTRSGAFFVYLYRSEPGEEPAFERITPRTPEQARNWLETYKSADISVDIIEALFAETLETGATEVKYTLRMPESFRGRLAALAKANNQSLNAWIIRCLETCAASEKSTVETAATDEALTFREEMPRVYELRDLIGDPSKSSEYFQDFDKSLSHFPYKKEVWLAREREFKRLDGESWQRLKDEARPYLSCYNPNGRAWEQLISIINQARAHNYLVDRGCSNVTFIQSEMKKGQKTPDLSAELGGQSMLCEVKTINVSDNELERRRSGMVGALQMSLDENFLKKLDATITQAITQMKAFCEDNMVTRVVFIVLTFDDIFGESSDTYFTQIDIHLGKVAYQGIDIVFYNQQTAFHPNITMSHAHVINGTS